VTYAAVDRQLPELIAKHRPQALLMFGLAARTPYVRIETRARNAVTTIWPDAEHARLRKGSIAREADAMMFGPHTAKLLRAALGSGIDARASRNAGSYLCNYLSWRAIEATRHDPEKWEPVFGKDHAQTSTGPRLAAFIHVPLLARDGISERKGNGRRIRLEELVDAGEAMLMEMVKLTRQIRRVGSH
jgi:pyroglutamyl-peptidase